MLEVLDCPKNNEFEMHFGKYLKAQFHFFFIMKLLFFNFVSKASSVEAFSFPTVPGLKVITPKKRTRDTSSMRGAIGSGKDQYVPLLQSLGHYWQSTPKTVPSLIFFSFTRELSPTY